MKTFWIKTKALLAKYWYVVVGALVVLVWFILARGRGGDALKKWRDVEKKIDVVEERKEHELEVIEARHEERIAEIETEHAVVVETLSVDEKKRADELRSSPRRLNKYLNSLLPMMACLLLSQQAYAQDWQPPEPRCDGDLQIVILDEGAIAPFDGQFFTDDAAACFAQRIGLCAPAANAEIDRRSYLCEANRSAFQASHDAEVEALEDTIDILEDEFADALEEPWYESFGFRVSLGFVVGVGAGYLLHELIK